MHMKHHRNPGNGYRSNPMGGMNMAVGSHTSPEGPTRGPGYYNSESRNFNRSFSRNQSQTHHRSFHRPPPALATPARADVFMEVGRLAAEYLVSQGVLPPSALPGKWQNGGLKKQLSEFQEFRPQEEENMQFPAEARTSALARLGNTGFDGGSSRRKYNDDYGIGGTRNHARGKRKGGSSRNYSSDWGREYGRTGSWSDRHRDRTSPSMDLDQDSSSRRREEHPVSKDNGERMAVDYDSSSRRHEEKQFGKDDESMDIDRDTRSKRHEEQPLGKGDSDMSDLSGTSVTPPKGMENKDLGSEIKEQNAEEISGIKDSEVVKDTREVTKGELKIESVDWGSSQQIRDNDLRISREETEDLRNSRQVTEEINGSGKDETVKEIVFEDREPKHIAVPVKPSEKNGTDLRALCRFANVPTRIRSSLASKGVKGRSILGAEGKDHVGPSEVIMVDDKTVNISTNYASPGDCNEAKVLNPEMCNVLLPQVGEGIKELHSDDSVEPARDMETENSLGDGKPDSALPVNQASDARPESLDDGMLKNDHSSNQELHGSESRDPVVEARCEKLPHERIDMDGGNARRKDWLYQSTRDWLSPASVNAGECSSLANPINNETEILGDSVPGTEKAIRADQGSLAGNFELPEVLDQPNSMDTQVKQLFPNSFKICDLNLMESSDANENHDRDAIFMYPSVSSVKKNATPVDIDLSICNSVTSMENDRRVADSREIEIIDLEGDSAQQEKTFNMTERRTETAFMGLDGFSAPASNTADIPDSQDGYGLMISELLANDFPNCTSVPGEINPLDNMGLHNGQGPLTDDDSIYMSLGEIPFLSFLGNWENPPPQEDGKPF